MEEVTDTLERNMARWCWGELHAPAFENQSLAQCGIGLIETLFNRWAVPVDDKIAMVNNTGYSTNDPYGMAIVSSYR